jgi:hypothetical protein
MPLKAKQLGTFREAVLDSKKESKGKSVVGRIAGTTECQGLAWWQSNEDRQLRIMPSVSVSEAFMWFSSTAGKVELKLAFKWTYNFNCEPFGRLQAYFS